MAERSLTTAIEEHRDVNSLQLVAIIRGVAEGLGHANRRGYVHRDVSPNNILKLVDNEQRRWVVADWGLVRKPTAGSSPRMTTRRHPIGTQGFVAPEALLDPKNSDESCDVFALGRVAHFGDTGIWPSDSFPLPELGWPWKEFVALCTAAREGRPKTFAEVLRLVREIERGIRRMEDEAEGLAPCPRCNLPIGGARCERCGLLWD